MNSNARRLLCLLVPVVLAGCHTIVEDIPSGASGGGAEYVYELTPGSSAGQPAPTPTPEPQTAPTPEPTPAATPEPTPQPTPEPTPKPSGGAPSGCGGLAVTIGATCAGSNPGCGITDHKSPSVSAKKDALVLFDASFFIGTPRDKIHAEDRCYPGPITSWRQTSGPSVGCKPPFSDGHSITCGRFDTPGAYGYRACGEGLCGDITLVVH